MFFKNYEFELFADKARQFSLFAGYYTVMSEPTTLQATFNLCRGSFSLREALISNNKISLAEKPYKLRQSNDWHARLRVT